MRLLPLARDTSHARPHHLLKPPLDPATANARRCVLLRPPARLKTRAGLHPTSTISCYYTLQVGASTPASGNSCSLLFTISFHQKMTKSHNVSERVTAIAQECCSRWQKRAPCSVCGRWTAAAVSKTGFALRSLYFSPGSAHDVGLSHQTVTTAAPGVMLVAEVHGGMPQHRRRSMSSLSSRANNERRHSAGAPFAASVPVSAALHLPILDHCTNRTGTKVR